MIEYSPTKILIFSLQDFLLGFLWFSPLLFAEPWKESVELTDEKINERQMKNTNMGKLFAIQICFNIISILSLSYLMVNVNPATLSDALTLAFIVWLGFTAGAQFGPVLWESKPITYFLINTGWRLTSMMIFTTGYYLF